MSGIKTQGAKNKAKIQEEFKAYSVVWECNKGHKNFQTIIGELDGLQHDICLKCGKHYYYKVENEVNINQDPALNLASVSNSALPKLTDFAVSNFDNIAEATKKITTGNVAHHRNMIEGLAKRCSEFIRKHY